MSENKKTDIQIPIGLEPSPPSPSPRQNGNITQQICITPISLPTLFEEMKLEIYSRSKTVKLLSVIDMIFLIINFAVLVSMGSLFLLFFFLFPLCYLGYCGAKEYKKNKVLAYCFYIGIMTFFYLSLSIYYKNLLLLLILFIEIYFLIYTTKLYKLLSKAPTEVLNQLLDGWKPNNYIYYYY